MSESAKANESCVRPGERLAVDAKTAAAMVSLGERTWWRLNSACKTPQSFMLGGRRVWRRADLAAWAAMGFPNRDEFRQRKAAGGLPVACVGTD